jgi:hypothetical protein
VLAATAAGLYALGNGWMEELSGPFHLVAGDGERVHAAGDRLYAREENWTAVDLPTEGRVAGVGYGERTYAVTEEGVVLVADGGEWRSRSLGLPEVRGLAVPASHD